MYSDTDIMKGLHDVPNHQVIELENGNRLNLIRKDPYGFIYLSLDRGALPVSLAGAAYTDWDQAKRAAYGYVKDRQEVVTELKDKADLEPRPQPVAKRKLQPRVP